MAKPTMWTQGDDTFVNGAGSETIDGKNGIDTLVYDGSYLGYQISLKDTGNLKTTVTALDGGAVDELKHVEFLRFDDGVYDIAANQFDAFPAVSISNGQVVEG